MNMTPEGSSEDVRDDGRTAVASAPASPTSGGPAGGGPSDDRRRRPKSSSSPCSSDDETSSTRSGGSSGGGGGSGSGGDHHSLPSIDDVDEIDPEAVDFQPLLLSDSGTAMTYDAHHDHGVLKGTVDRQVRRHSWSGDLPLGDDDACGDYDGRYNDDDVQRYEVAPPEQEPEGRRGELLAFVFSYFVHEILKAYRLLRIRLLGPAAQSISPKLERIGDETGASLSSSLQVCGAFFVVLMVVAFASGSTTIQRNPEYARAAGNGAAARDRAAPAPNRLASTAFSGRSGNLRLPETMKLFRNVDELPLEMTDTAVFWHVPRSGGTTMKHVLSMCLGRVVASEVGADSALDENLEVKQTPYGNYVNVDTTTPLGIQRAKTMGLAQSGQADVIFSPFVHEIASLFDEHHRGRFLTVLRDPVDRIVSLYYYRRIASWIPNFDPNLKDITLTDFVKTHGENWMVRSLVDKMSGPLSESDLETAKEILRTKFLIGLLDEKTESLRRFESYFGWKMPSPIAQNCKNNMFYFEPQGKNRYPPLREDSEERRLIENLNRYDVELYAYAKELFESQRELFFADDGKDGIENEFGWGTPEEIAAAAAHRDGLMDAERPLE